MQGVPGLRDAAAIWRLEMQVKYFPEDDIVEVFVARSKDGDGAALRDYFGVVLAFAEVGCEDITGVDIIGISQWLPLCAEKGYDAATDTLTLGDKPEADYRVVDNGDFVSYRQWFDDGSEWDILAVDLRHASVHLAEVIANPPPPHANPFFAPPEKPGAARDTMPALGIPAPGD